MASIEVVIPPGVQPGQIMQVQTPDGQLVQVQVPRGAGPGTVIRAPYQPREQSFMSQQSFASIDLDDGSSSSGSSRGGGQHYQHPRAEARAPPQHNMRGQKQSLRLKRGSTSQLKSSTITPKSIFGNCFAVVSPDELLAVERFGSFKGTRSAGCHVLGCDWGGHVIKVRKISTRVQELNLGVETKTKDNVFVELAISVQVEVAPDKGYEAIYRLNNPIQQIESLVADIVRGTVPNLKLDELFEAKDEIASAVKERLTESLSGYGYRINQVLVTDLLPDHRVKEAMNEIDAARRMRVATIEKAEANKTLVVKAAEADSESLFLQGQGIARQRMAIVDGLKAAMGMGMDADPEEVQELMLITAYFDTLEKLANGKNTTIFMPHSVGYLGQIAKEVRTGTQGAPAQLQMAKTGAKAKGIANL